jgi:hypothetical protein
LEPDFSAIPVLDFARILASPIARAPKKSAQFTTGGGKKFVYSPLVAAILPPPLDKPPINSFHS